MPDEPEDEEDDDPIILLPPVDEDGKRLRAFTEDELARMDIRSIGVDGEGDHIQDEVGPDGSGSTRRFSCAWKHRYAAALHFVGAVKSYPDESGKVRISRLAPQRHPAVTVFNWVATKAAIDPFRYTGELEEGDVEDALPRFDRAHLTVTYELVPYQVLDDDEVDEDYGEMLRYVVEPGYPGADVTTEVNYVTLPGGVLKYRTADGVSPPANVPIPYGVGFPETYSKKKVIFRRVPFDCWGSGKTLTNRIKGTATTRGYIGALNRVEVWGHPPLTLQLTGVEERLLPDPTGMGYSWDLVYCFSEKSVTSGHLGFYYHAVNGAASSGYYQAGRGGGATEEPGDIGDTDSLFVVRDLRDAFVVGAL